MTYKSITKNVQISSISTNSNALSIPTNSLIGNVTTNLFNRLLSTLDSVAANVQLDEGESFTEVSNNLSLIVVDDSMSYRSGVGQSLIMLERPNISELGFRSDQFKLVQGNDIDMYLEGEKVNSRIYIPASALVRKTASRISFTVFGNDNVFKSNSSSAEVNNGSLSSGSVNSFIISATVVDKEVSSLAENVTIYTTLMKDLDDGEKSVCSSWNKDAFEWSDRGCYLNDISTNSLAICNCDHLANYATLTQRDTETNTTIAYNNGIVIIAGCSISSVALVIALALFSFVPDLRTARRFRSAFLLANLCIALLGLNIMLIINNVFSLTDETNSCIAIAAITHFFFLSAFAWMNNEAANLYISLCKPLYARSKLTNRKIVSWTVGWGWIMPTVFVGILCIVDAQQYQYSAGDCTACCPQQEMILFYVIIPAGILLGVNLLVYLMIVESLMCKKHRTDWIKAHTNCQSTWDLWKNLLINASLAVMFGLTWTFGLLILGASKSDPAATLVVSSIFSILNALLGFFILLLYIMRNRDAKNSIFSVTHSTITRYRETFTLDYSSVATNPYATGESWVRNDTTQGYNNEAYEEILEVASQREVGLRASFDNHKKGQYAQRWPKK